MDAVPAQRRILRCVHRTMRRAAFYAGTDAHPDLCRSRPADSSAARQGARRDGAWRRPYRRLLSRNARPAAGLGAALRRRGPRRLRAGLAGPWPLADGAGLCKAWHRGCRTRAARTSGARSGPSVLLVHSASGPMAWWMAEQRPDLVAAVVGIAPGPPANLLADLPDDPAAILALRDDAQRRLPGLCARGQRRCGSAPNSPPPIWANAPRFPKPAFENYRRSIVPESARILNERFNIGGRGLRIGDPGSLGGHRS